LKIVCLDLQVQYNLSKPEGVTFTPLKLPRQGCDPRAAAGLLPAPLDQLVA